MQAAARALWRHRRTVSAAARAVRSGYRYARRALGRRVSRPRVYGGGLRRSAALLNRNYQRNVNTFHQVSTVGPYTIELGKRSSPMVGTYTYTDGRVIHCLGFLPGIIADVARYYETLYVNKVQVSVVLRNLVMPQLIDGSSNDVIEMFRTSPWMLWIGSDSTFRNVYDTGGGSLFLELVGASGVEAFQNSHYKTFVPQNLTNGVVMTTTIYRTRGNTAWRIDPSSLVSTAISIPEYDGGDGAELTSNLRVCRPSNVHYQDALAEQYLNLFLPHAGFAVRTPQQPGVTVLPPDFYWSAVFDVYVTTDFTLYGYRNLPDHKDMDTR